MSDNLTHRTVKNSVYSVVGFVWPLLLSFITAPIIVRGLGSSRFGLYALLNTMLGLFGLLDFGLSYTLTQALSENRTNPGNSRVSVIFSSTVMLYAAIGVIFSGLIILLPDVFRDLFQIPADFISSYTLAFMILGLVFIFKMITVPIFQVAYSMQRLDVVTIINLSNATLLQIGSIWVLKTGHGMLALLIVQLIGSVFWLATNYWAWKKLAPELKFKIKFSKEIFSTIGQQSFWVFFSNTMVNILTQFDKFVLGAIFGPTSVGYYSTAQMIPEKISGASFTLSHTFFPIFAETNASSQDGGVRIKSIFRRGLSLIPILTGGLATLVLVYGYELINFWINKDFADNTLLAVKLLAVTYFLLGFNNFFNSFLSGLKALKFLAFSTMLIALIDVAFIFILIPHYSVNGAAWAYLISALPILGILYVIERKYFNSSVLEIFSFYGKLFGQIIFCAAITFLLGKFFIRPILHNLWEVMIWGAVSFVFYLGLFWLFKFYTQQDKDLFKHYARVFLARIKIL